MDKIFMDIGVQVFGENKNAVVPGVLSLSMVATVGQSWRVVSRIAHTNTPGGVFASRKN